MKFVHILTLVVVACIAGNAVAVVPLDRPTPPPCCVDGVCHAHASGFGYFPTRWRVWPGLTTAPMPTVQPPVIRQIPGIPSFVTPTPEEEDRQAPEPTKSPSSQSEISVPAGSVPPTVPLDPRDGGDAGSTSPYPRPTTTPGFPSPTTTPGFPTSPSTPQSTPPFGGQPSADLDRPPAPPFAVNRGRVAPIVQPANRPVANWSNAGSQAPPANLPSPRAATRSANDPPPALPLALQNAAL